MEVREKLANGKRLEELSLRVCYYARVSTDHELQATSILNQVDFFIRYIQDHQNWQLVSGYVDEGISGKEVRKRENFLQMIEDGKRNKFDLVLTKSVSRFARNTIDSIRYTNLLLEYGVGVFFLNDNINTFYSDSEFRLTLMASIAQDEIRKLSESVRFGLKQSIKRGVVLGNNNILGYRKDKGKLVLDQEEVEIVQSIFRWFVMGKYTYREVGEMAFKKYGRKFDSTSIRRILTNYKYKGFYCGGKSTVLNYKNGKRRINKMDNWVLYRDYEKVPPIIEEEIWNQVQEIIERRKKKRRGDSDLKKYQGKVICGVHQTTMRFKKKQYRNKIYSYYVCPTCVSVSTEVLSRVERGSPFDMVYVIPGEELRLMVKCKTSSNFG